MMVILISLLNARFSTSLSYMHRLILSQPSLESIYLHFPVSQATTLAKHDKEILKKFCKDADIVGISVMSNFLFLAIEISELLRSTTYFCVSHDVKRFI